MENWPQEYPVPTSLAEATALYQQVGEKLQTVARNDPEAKTLHLVAGTCALVLADQARENGQDQLGDLLQVTAETHASLAAAVEDDDQMIDAFRSFARGAQTFAASTDYDGISSEVGDEADRFQARHLADHPADPEQ